MVQRFHFNPISVERKERQICLDDLVGGVAYGKFCQIFIPKDYEKSAKRTLMDHLIKTGNINHSLSWYLTLSQSLAFARLIEAGNKNHNVEEQLIRTIFEDSRIFLTKEFDVVDLGCGIGTGALLVMNLLEKSPSNLFFKHYFPVDGSPSFLALALENFTQHYNIDLVVSTNRLTRSLTSHEIASLDEVINKMRAIDDVCKKVTVDKTEISQNYSLTDILREISPRYKDMESTDVWFELCHDFKSGDEIKRRRILQVLKKYFFKKNIDRAREGVIPWPQLDLQDLSDRINLIKARGVIYKNFNEVDLVKSYMRIITNVFEKPDWNEKDVASIATYFDLIMFLFGEYEVDAVVPFNDQQKLFSSIEFSGFVGDILDPEFVAKVGLNTHDPERINRKHSRFYDAGLLSLFLGNTLGNFNARDRSLIISSFYHLSADGNYVLIGVELAPDNSFPQYKEECDKIAQGYEREGTKFLGETIKLLGEDPGKLDFKACFVYEERQDLIDLGFEVNSIAMFYDVKQDVIFTDGDRCVRFKAGSIIPAGSSYKFMPGEVAGLCRRMGFSYVDSKSFIPLPKKNEDTRPIYEVILARK